MTDEVTIQQKYKDKPIHLVHTITGQMILGRLRAETDTHLYLIQPRLVELMGKQMSLIPMDAFVNKQEIGFLKSGLLFNEPASDQMQENYIKSTAPQSSIITPQTPKLDLNAGKTLLTE